MRLLLVTGFTLAVAGAAQGQEMAMAADVRWEPQQPAQGTLIYLIVNPNIAGDELSVTGQMAGQELHFERDPSGEFRAVAPIRSSKQNMLDIHPALVKQPC